MPFRLVSDYAPAGDQPTAITQLNRGITQGTRNQVLLGVTGSGKTFTMAHIIQAQQKPALIMAHNKTLAAQLYSEMKSFFPENAVEYFVSYYDYFQPEAYVAKSDTYIEKDSAINEQIDRMRHSATRSMLERSDVIVVASVSCIYGIGSVETYAQMRIELKPGTTVDQRALTKRLVDIQYTRNDIDFHRGSFRVRGDNVDIFPSHLEDEGWRLGFFGDELESITAFDPLTGERLRAMEDIIVYANSHYVTPRPTVEKAIRQIKDELKARLADYRAAGKLLEAERIEQRTMFDLEMLMETGTCKGIENYSRYLAGTAPGEPPPTLFQYLPKDALLFVDESHVTVPQVGGMYKGDRARKSTLVEYGFRLPSCMDNRPLKFEEWDAMRPMSIFVSATPAKWEQEQAGGIVAEQVIRPTGLIDPPCEIRPVSVQVDDLLAECREKIKAKQRVLVTTLTKRMAEELTDYMEEAGIGVRYLHSDVDTLERIEIIRDLRLGRFDVLIGVNLLREGLDIPECGLVAILDADKEGFLRSTTSLIQTIGRAARNVHGKVILYADKITESMRVALDETARRRAIQQAYNERHGITPASIEKQVGEIIESVYEKDHVTVDTRKKKYDVDEARYKDPQQYISALRTRMLQAAADLEFEQAARLRDQLTREEMKLKKRAKAQAGFSLLELSIILVVMGLLIGGILAGSSMIHQSQLQGVISGVDRYKAAVKLFQDQYLALPGDMKNATTLWGAAHATHATCTVTVGTGTQTCNGDGDGRITIQSTTAAQPATYYEQFRAWQQLSNAKLIEGNYSGVSTGGANTQTYTAGTNCPKTSLKAGCFIIQSLTLTEATAQSTVYFPAYYGNYMRIAKGTDTALTPMLTAADAKAIDSKFDDGLPASGNVVSLRNPTTPGCLTTDVAATAAYDLTNSRQLCIVALLLTHS